MKRAANGRAVWNTSIAVLVVFNLLSASEVVCLWPDLFSSVQGCNSDLHGCFFLEWTATNTGMYIHSTNLLCSGLSTAIKTDVVFSENRSRMGTYTAGPECRPAGRAAAPMRGLRESFFGGWAWETPTVQPPGSSTGPNLWSLGMERMRRWTGLS
ncbi:hypothetical protein PVAP13_3KG226500 [Panicum virgatum]|uniref:Uncharacterized protein n=1 Tax=Panicum virgatum TaxID=38727 RepID=A0A8T0US95_PANVG|nr:hypothetical protein PVAP13_3KG226500 [Panicum virgatum]